jgi:hypothetical protein
MWKIEVVYPITITNLGSWQDEELAQASSHPPLLTQMQIEFDENI